TIKIDIYRLYKNSLYKCTCIENHSKVEFELINYALAKNYNGSEFKILYDGKDFVIPWLDQSEEEFKTMVEKMEIKKIGHFDKIAHEKELKRIKEADIQNLKEKIKNLFPNKHQELIKMIEVLEKEH